jgi:hypothetical protein
MRLGRHILSFALALLWLGLPVHCQLEAVSSASLLACADDTDCSSPADDNCSDDFCGSLESGKYFAHKVAVAAKFPAVAIHPWECNPAILPSFNDLPSEPSPRPAPPLLEAAWQFIQGAAAPPRAPASLS